MQTHENILNIPLSQLKEMPYSLGNSGIIFDRLPDILVKELNEKVLEVQNNFEKLENKNNELAGHLKRQYDLSPSPLFKNYINTLTNQHDYFFGTIRDCNFLNKNVPFDLTTLWVNFQEKYEFNPPHNHGGLVSFVIWHKIPYDIQKELDYFPNKPDNSSASLFGFIASNIYGQMSTQYIPVSREFEGVICMFPSQLFHFVNPFYTSNDYRITVAGNVHLVVD